LPIIVAGAAAASPLAWPPLASRAQQDDLVRALQIRILRQQAETAADKIAEFISGIESQVGWTTQLPWTADNINQRRFDGLRVLRQVAAITELAQLDQAGIEQLKVSRLAMDVVASKQDYSNGLEFKEAVAKKVYYGPVHFLVPQRIEADHCEVEERDAISGVGVGVAMPLGQVRVVCTLENMPATHAGLMAGDIIIAIDDEPVGELTLAQVVEKMRGPANTMVKLTIRPSGHREPLVLSITRGVIFARSSVNLCPPVPQPASRSQPYMTLSLAGTRRDAGVSVALVSLKLLRELISAL
jgi:PDZ domain